MFPELGWFGQGEAGPGRAGQRENTAIGQRETTKPGDCQRRRRYGTSPGKYSGFRRGNEGAHSFGGAVLGEPELRHVLEGRVSPPLSHLKKPRSTGAL